MYKVVVGLYLVLFFIIGEVQGQVQDFDSFRQTEGLVCKKGVLSVYQHGKRVYLEIPEVLLGRDFVFVAQVNKGAEMAARPLSSIGVFRFRLGEDDKIYFYQEKYRERIVSRKHPLFGVFENSNLQPVSDVFDIVAVNSVEKGYIIDITDVLMRGKGWFKAKHSQLRDHTGEMKLSQIIADVEGVVFTFKKECDYIYPVQAAGVKGREGTIMVELGCMLRLLPQEQMDIKNIGNIQGLRAIKYSVYGRSPYGIMQDSLAIRWRFQIPDNKRNCYNKGQKVRPVKPLIFYVNSSFPDRWYTSVVKAVEFWNKGLEKAGYINALQVLRLSDDVPSVACKALISYDLSEPVVTNELMVHPETGEILNCRINLGHGLWEKERDRYFLLHGLKHDGTLKNIDSQEISKELLYELLRGEIGKALGLKDGNIEMGEELLAYIYGKSSSFCGKEKNKSIVGSLMELDKRIQTIDAVYECMKKEGQLNRELLEREAEQKHMEEEKNKLYKECLQQGIELLQLVKKEEDMKEIERFMNTHFFEAEVGLEYENMQEIVRNMLEERTLRHLANVKLLAGWFSIIQGAVVGDGTKLRDMPGEMVNLRWNIVVALIDQATRLKIFACDEDYQAIFYFKLQELHEQITDLQQECDDRFANVFYKRLLSKLESSIIL